jgi:hypothetical protein
MKNSQTKREKEKSREKAFTLRAFDYPARTRERYKCSPLAVRHGDIWDNTMCVFGCVHPAQSVNQVHSVWLIWARLVAHTVVGRDYEVRKIPFSWANKQWMSKSMGRHEPQSILKASGLDSTPIAESAISPGAAHSGRKRVEILLDFSVGLLGPHMACRTRPQLNTHPNFLSWPTTYSASN